MLWFNQNCSTISGSTSSACGSNAWTTSERKSRKPEALLAEAASWEDPPAVLRCAGCAGNFANNNNSNVNVVDFLFFFLCLGIFFDNFYSLVHHLEFIFRPDFSHRWDFRAPHRSWLNIDEESSEDPPPSLLDIDFTAGWIVVLLRSFTFMQHQLNGVAHSIGLRIQHPPEFFFFFFFFLPLLWKQRVNGARSYSVNLPSDYSANSKESGASAASIHQEHLNESIDNDYRYDFQCQTSPQRGSRRRVNPTPMTSLATWNIKQTLNISIK